MSAQFRIMSLRRGFTLLELLVVVAIIAVLLSILMPALRGARDQAKGVQCASNQRTLCQALFYYAQDNRDALPGVDGADPRTAWWNAIDQHLDKRVPPSAFDCRRDNMPAVMFCPMGKRPFPKLYMPAGGIEITHYFLNGVERELGMSFGQKLGIGLFGGDGKLTDADAPGECMLMGDMVNFNKIADLDHPAVLEIFDERSADVAAARMRYHHRATAGFVHDGKINLTYADGHGARVPGIPVADDYANNPSQWPAAMRNDPTLFYPYLRLSTAREAPRLWGPPYEDYELPEYE